MPWIHLHDAALHYAESGEGPPLLLLHEMGGCLESWKHVVPLLSGWRVIRPDMRGAGLSQKILGEISMDALVGDLTGLLDALHIKERVDIAGCAVGAALALSFAARHPDRVGSVIAMAPATGIPPERRQTALDLAAQIEREGFRARMEQRIDTTFLLRYRSNDARLEEFMGITMANDPRSYAAIYRMLAALDLSAALQQISCPCLLLAGETDATRPAEIVAAVAAEIPGAVFRRVASGHVMAMLTPALVAQTINGFAAR